jgi:hypothetical protein
MQWEIPQRLLFACGHLNRKTAKPMKGRGSPKGDIGPRVPVRRPTRYLPIPMTVGDLEPGSLGGKTGQTPPGTLTHKRNHAQRRLDGNFN